MSAQNNKSIEEKIADFDISLFAHIPTETTDEDRSSLLAVQNAIASRSGRYCYMEIGSHLGGSIQPHLLDPRCKQIFSIDPRPTQFPHDTVRKFVTYPENSTERMLKLLASIDPNGLEKIQCIEQDADAVDRAIITNQPDLVFIDGEHTQSAVLSDFQLADDVLAPNGVILFHDFGIVYPAIFEICRNLKSKDVDFLPVKLGGSLFGVFFDPELFSTVRDWSDVSVCTSWFIFWYQLRRKLLRFVPSWLRRRRIGSRLRRIVQTIRR